MLSVQVKLKVLVTSFELIYFLVCLEYYLCTALRLVIPVIAKGTCIYLCYFLKICFIWIYIV